MCGILIFKAKNINSEIRKTFYKSLGALKNRGPDETRVVENKNTLIGFTRLSINDIRNGSQPFRSPCGRYIIVFNGEIVNYKILAKELRERNFKLRYGHEAEVILKLYSLYGKNCVNFLRGFFAFVIIEVKSNNIFSAVDRYSIKPLYYVQNSNKNIFVITSDYSFLIKSEFLERRLNFEKLTDYFTLARDFDNKTIFRGIKKLRASSILIQKDNQQKTFKYWTPFKKEEVKEKSYEKLADITHEKFLEVTNLWKVADTKSSLSLSSGLDSQVLNRYFHKNKANISRFNLIENRRKFFNYENTKKIKLNTSEIINLLNDFTKKSLNPFAVAHSSCTSLFQLYSHLKNKNFKFTLNGEGSDEIFGGYERYKRQLFYIKNRKLNFENSVIKIYEKDIKNFSNSLKKENIVEIKKELKNKIKSINLKSKDIENKILEFDQITWIPFFIQRHDFIGMHFGLEVRPPYLDHELAELANSLPKNLKFSLDKSKVILKNLLKEKFNDTFSYKKQGAPSVFNLILKNKNEMESFKESLFYGELSNFFDCDKIIRDLINNYQNKNFIFLWRLYILNKMLVNF